MGLRSWFEGEQRVEGYPPPKPEMSEREHLARIDKRLDEIAATAKKAAGDLSLLAGLALVYALLLAFGLFVTFCGALG